jgi:predicted amidohydrolase
MDIAWEDPPENFRRAAILAERAVAEGARLVVLPEMFATGFSMNAALVSGFAGDAKAFLSGLASRLSAWVLGGYGEPGEPRPANACSIFDPAGEEVLHFRKLHLFTLSGEDRHYAPGDSLATVDVEGVRITPLICYDLRFPEPFRAAARRTDLFCVPANWPDKRADAWSTLLRARAMENQAYVLGVNRVGEVGGELHSGHSALVDPMGKDVAVAESGVAGILSGDVDAVEVARARERFSALRDRRPDVYGRLEDG